MGLAQRRRAVLQQRANELGLGKSRRTYGITGVMGSLGQMGRRSLMLVLAFCFGVVVFFRPTSTLLKAAIIGGALLALFGLAAAWRRVCADLEMNRCCLYPGGLVVTGLSGQARDAVAWTDVTAVKRSYGAWLLTAFHRIELVRRGAPPVTFLVLGARPALVTALQEQAARSGIPQHDVLFRVS